MFSIIGLISFLRFRCVLFALLFLSFTAWADNDARYTVYHLYRDFGWQALFESSGEAEQYLGKSITGQSRGVLNKYFDPQLTQLILNEADCNARSRGELCKLDFDPIFASQDDAAINMVIKDAVDGNVVVQYEYPSNSQKVSMEFKLRRIPAGWRIYDILYLNYDNRSLRGILKGK
ncbi:DUF3828 domain-containing protein [Xanthomonas albilineans]|uniref:DUF3828 domain-containing protein n=1 Tax=Xanthomonas albilineans TaxID=29447 RepID=UPI0012D39971|nr:DUF3828 domain-containing protein [Xanthomonas albilineans]